MLDWTFEAQETNLAAARRAAPHRVDSILRPLGLRCARIEPMPGTGVNNPVYTVWTTTGVVLALRITNPHALHARHKTRSEVEAMVACRKLTTLPVPEVLSHASSREEHGFEYVLMERVPGIPLSDLWPTLDARSRLGWATQVAKIIAELDATELPHTNVPARIGGFGPNLVPSVLRGDHPPLGPFATVADRMKGELHWAADSLDAHASLLGPMAQALASRLRTLDLALPTAEPELGFRHDDLHAGNLLVDPTTTTLTGLLDWEHAGVGPLDTQWLGLQDWVGREGDLAWTRDFAPVLRSLGLERPPDLDGRESASDIVNEAVWCTYFVSAWYHHHPPDPRREAWLLDLRSRIARLSDRLDL